MRTIYLDYEFKCHITNDGNMVSVETNFFDGKCDEYIEGYRFIPTNETWTRSDGVVFSGEMIFPWKDFTKLDIAQRIYEKELLNKYEAELAELDAAMLEMQYQNLVEGL